MLRCPVGDILTHSLCLAVGFLAGMATLATLYPCRRIRRRPPPAPVVHGGRTAGEMMRRYEPRSP